MKADSEASFSFSMFCIKLLDSSESLGLFTRLCLNLNATQSLMVT